MSKEGKSLIITSMRTDLGSRGGHDEWISHQNAEGEWQDPLNLGDAVNTGRGGYVLDIYPGWQEIYGQLGAVGTYDMDIRWVNKDDVPLLKDFEPIGPTPNLLKNGKVKAETDKPLRP